MKITGMVHMEFQVYDPESAKLYVGTEGNDDVKNNQNPRLEKPVRESSTNRMLLRIALVLLVIVGVVGAVVFLVQAEQ